MSDKITIENARVTDKGVEFKTAKTGKEFSEFTVMWSSGRKNQQTGEREYGPTKFAKVRVFGFNAADIAAGIKPGDRVNVTGNVEHFTWESNDGPKDDWSVFAESVTFPVPRAPQGGQQPQQQQQGGFQNQNFPQAGQQQNQQGGFNNQQQRTISQDAPF